MSCYLKEMAETEAKKAEKEATIEKLSTSVDSMTAKSNKLKEQVAELQKQLASLAGSQAEADKIRAEEKGAYDANSAEMEKGVEGVKLALKVLNDYYSKDDKSHSSADGAGGGIIGLLEVCIVRLWVWTCSQNKTSQSVHTSPALYE
jgi:HK97 family phage major capsid protein